MNHLQTVISAIKNLDFPALYNILDDKNSYMDVPKETFLNALENKLKPHQAKGLDSFDEVLTGTCGECNKGCEAYSFYKKGFPHLNLFFEVQHDQVKDIYLCHKLLGLKHKVHDNDIYLKFHEEEKVDFKPSLKYLMQKQKADKAVEDFKRIACDPLIDVEDLVYWRDKYNDIVGPFGFNSPLDYYTYKAFFEFDAISSNVYNFTQAYDANENCLKALDHYYNIVDLEEREMVKWLFMRKSCNTYFNFNGTEHWQKTAMVKLSKDSELMVDCTSCMHTLKFEEIYGKEQNKLLEKYQPTIAHYKANNNSITYGLKSFLKLHGKYLDLLDI